MSPVERVFGLEAENVNFPGASGYLRVSFNPPFFGETGISSYRIFVAEAASDLTILADFDVQLLLLSPSHYHVIIPNGTAQSFIFPPGKLTNLSNPIFPDTDYRVVVFSMGDGIVSTCYVLSTSMIVRLDEGPSPVSEPEPGADDASDF